MGHAYSFVWSLLYTTIVVYDNTIQFKCGLHRGEIPAPVSLVSMKRQAELEQEGEQEPVDDKSNVNS